MDLLSSAAEDLNVEDEDGVRGDIRSSSLSSIAVVRGENEGSALTNLHGSDTLVPAGDDLALAKAERERTASSGRIELRAIQQSSGVVNLHVTLSQGSITLLGDFLDEALS